MTTTITHNRLFFSGINVSFCSFFAEAHKYDNHSEPLVGAAEIIPPDDGEDENNNKGTILNNINNTATNNTKSIVHAPQDLIVHYVSSRMI